MPLPRFLRRKRTYFIGIPVLIFLVAVVRVGAVPSASTTVFPFGSFGSWTRSTGTLPVTTSGVAELSTRLVSPP